MKTVNVAVYRVGQPPLIEAIPDTLEAQQAIVGGYIKDCVLDHLTVIYNAEGRDEGLPVNRQVGTLEVVGDFFICRVNSEGQTANITDTDMKFLLKNYDL